MTTSIQAQVESAPTDPAPHPRRRAAVLALVVTAILTVAAVVAVYAIGSGPSDQQRAASEVNAGLAAQKAGDLTGAANHYRKAMSLDSRNVYAAYDFGVVSGARGDVAAAESAYRKAITIRPAYEPALFNYGVLLQRRGNDASAISMYQRAVRANPNDPRAHFNLGLMLRATPKYAADGLAQLQIAVRLDPSLVAGARAKATQ